MLDPTACLQVIISLFSNDDPSFVEVTGEVYDYFLKAEVPRAEKEGAYLIGDRVTDIEHLGEYVGVYPAFYTIGERTFARLETVEVFEKNDPREIIEQEFDIKPAQPKRLYTRPYYRDPMTAEQALRVDKSMTADSERLRRWNLADLWREHSWNQHKHAVTPHDRASMRQYIKRRASWY